MQHDILHIRSVNDYAQYVGAPLSLKANSCLCPCGQLELAQW